MEADISIGSVMDRVDSNDRVDIVDRINDEYEDWVSVLYKKLQKLKLIVSFSDMEGQDQLLELIDDIRNTEIKL